MMEVDDPRIKDHECPCEWGGKGEVLALMGRLGQWMTEVTHERFAQLCQRMAMVVDDLA